MNWTMARLVHPMMAKKTPQTPPAAASIDPGEQGGDDGSEQGEIGPFAMV
jgi:hypothetical protein